MNGFLRFNGIRKTTAAFAIVAFLALGLGAGSAIADDIGGEDVVIPPPAPAPAAPPPPPPVEEDKYKLYLTGIVGYSWAKGEAGGDNRCCLGGNNVQVLSSNTGDDWDGTVFGGAALGIDADFGPVGGRFEVEGQGGRNYEMKTDGPFPPGDPLAGTPYRLKAHTWAIFFNLFLDIPITENFDLYMGGGVGFGVHDYKVSIPAVGLSETSHDDLNFAWQVGGGMAYDVADWLTLDLGYRYVDFGTMDTDLPFPVFGDHQLKLTSHDLILGVRLNYYSF
jgi:outer membrane immunogenic protein